MSDADTGKPHVVAIANTYTRWLWRSLLERLASELNATPILLVGTPQDERFYRQQFGSTTDMAIEVLQDPYNLVIGGAQPADTDDLEARAVAFEKRFGITLAREFVLADRHLGRGYLTLGSGHPRSQVSAAMTRSRTLAACVAQIEYTQALFARLRPAVVVSYYGGGGLRGKPFSLLCREAGVPFRALCPARFGDLMYWAEDEFEGNRELRSLLSLPAPRLSANEIETTVADLQPSGLATNSGAVARARRGTKLSVITYRTTRMLAQRCYGRLRGYQFARTGYSVWSNAAFMYRQRRHWRELEQHATRDIESLQNRKFVYFPLQQEPEASTLVLSPEHPNQEATLIELSLSLPADCTLVVKEHLWQVGRRPDGFYRRISEIPNVLLIHPEASSLMLIKMAALVCTISSSAGYESAVLGQRTVFFWKRALLSVVGHVHALARFAPAETLPNLLSESTDANVAERENDGAVILRRLRQFCFDLSPLKIHGRQQPPSQEELDVLLLPMLRSLTSTKPPPSSQQQPAGGSHDKTQIG
jgi:hypothetical protein